MNDEQKANRANEQQRLNTKLQCVRCLTCKHIFAVTVEEHANETWFKNLAKYVKTENCKVETMTIGELEDQFGYGVDKCCGRKPKIKNEAN